MIPLNIWIVEDDAGYRRTLRKILNHEEHINCDRVFSSCPDLFDALRGEAQPNLVLMDLGLPGISGVEGIRKLAEIAPDVAVVVLTVFSDKRKVLDALDAGAVAYLLKSSTQQEIVQGINDVFVGGASLSPTVAKIVLEQMRKPKNANHFSLTQREIEVLKLLAEGLAAKQIAHQMGVSIHTVAFHLKNIYAKLDVHSQSGAIAKAFQAGIL
jgi:DNA-binding NarL/FixJ family response regulator